MGSKVAAWPASVPTVSTPTPRMSRSLARNGTHFGSKPGVRSVIADIEILLGIAAALRPVGADQHPCAVRDASMPALPVEHHVRGQEKVCVLLDPLRDVDDAG